MDLREVGNLSSEDEYRHWWIATRFGYIDRALKMLPEGALKVLEVGCGTGQNLRYLLHQSCRARDVTHALGVDLHLPADFKPSWQHPKVSWARQMPAQDQKQKFDVIMAMDVLEHIEEDQAALKEWCSYLAPGGVLLITVPAFPVLWSYHDELLHHYRRYTRDSLFNVCQSAGLSPQFLRYAFAPFFPAVLLLRKLRQILGGRPPLTTDLKLPPMGLNPVLYSIGRWEQQLGGNPWMGTSVVGIFKS